MAGQRVDVMICTRDRPTELALLLQSLRTQTHKDFKVWIYDDRSGTPILNHHFLQCIVNRMTMEGNIINYFREDSIRWGVTKLRRMLVDKIMRHGEGNYILRLDDDLILKENCIEKLLEVISQGYDIAGGLVPDMPFPEFRRETRFVKPFIADIRKENGKLVIGDDCGYAFLTEEIIPSPHFRSIALIKREVHEKVNYEENLGFSSWREEEFFSFRAIAEGFKIGIHTGAILWHLRTPSGGERTAEYHEKMALNEELLKELYEKLCLEKGYDILEKYRERFK